jgi:hypothetical protein
VELVLTDAMVGKTITLNVEATNGTGWRDVTVAAASPVVAAPFEIYEDLTGYDPQDPLVISLKWNHRPAGGMSIAWGDGETDGASDGSTYFSHRYAEAGTYTITATPPTGAPATLTITLPHPAP